MENGIKNKKVENVIETRMIRRKIYKGCFSLNDVTSILFQI